VIEGAGKARRSMLSNQFAPADPEATHDMGIHPIEAAR
jgi:hypothetical protein